jgi:nicotinamidase/pyrazinamidase
LNTLSRRRFLTAAGVVAAASAAAPLAGLRDAIAADAMKVTARDALLVIDVQNCFIPGGTLPVPKGEEVVPLVNELAGKFSCVVMTQDWHTPGHVSFASTHG